MCEEANGTSSPEDRALKIHLKEYDRLRDEIELNLKAEDGIINYSLVLLAALVASAFLPKAADLTADLARVRDALLAWAPLFYSGLYVVLCKKLGNNRRITNYIVRYLRPWLAGAPPEGRLLEWDFRKRELDDDLPATTDCALPEWLRGLTDGHYLILGVLPAFICATALGVLGKLVVTLAVALPVVVLAHLSRGCLREPFSLCLSQRLRCSRRCVDACLVLLLGLASFALLWLLGYTTAIPLLAVLLALFAHSQRVRLDHALVAVLEEEREQVEPSSETDPPGAD